MNSKEIAKDIIVAAIQKGYFDNVMTDFSDEENPDTINPKIRAIATAFQTIESIVDGEVNNSPQPFHVDL